MWARTIIVALMVAFVVGGSTQRRGYRVENIRNRYPQWDELTVQKVAARRVEIGMSREMVREALGKADKISQQGNEEKWGYEIIIDRYTRIERAIVYTVYFENGRVVRTAGDRSKLLYAN